MAIVYGVWGKVAIVYGVWGKVAIVYGVFQKRLYLNQGPEKKGVSDEFFFIFLNPDLHSLAKKNDRSRRLFFSSALTGPFRHYFRVLNKFR